RRGSDVGYGLLWLFVLFFPFAAALNLVVLLLAGPGGYAGAWEAMFASAPGDAVELGPAATTVLAALTALLFPVTNAPVEELYYRGHAQGELEARGAPAWLTVLLPAAAFGVQHVFLAPTAGAMLAYVAAFAAWGAAAGVVYRRQRRLMPLIVAHLLTNPATAAVRPPPDAQRHAVRRSDVPTRTGEVPPSPLVRPAGRPVALRDPRGQRPRRQARLRRQRQRRGGVHAPPRARPPGAGGQLRPGPRREARRLRRDQALRPLLRRGLHGLAAGAGARDRLPELQRARRAVRRHLARALPQDLPPRRGGRAGRARRDERAVPPGRSGAQDRRGAGPHPPRGGGQRRALRAPAAPAPRRHERARGAGPDEADRRRARVRRPPRRLRRPARVHQPRRARAPRAGRRQARARRPAHPRPR